MKTRAWDGERWRTDYVVMPKGKVYATINQTHRFPWKLYDPDIYAVEVDWKLSRFTELLDRNRKEIYEHHIVMIGNIKYVVVWSKSGFGLDQITVVPNPFGDLRVLPSLHRHLDETTVIGDVFLNPELLEV